MILVRNGANLIKLNFWAYFFWKFESKISVSMHAAGVAIFSLIFWAISFQPSLFRNFLQSSSMFMTWFCGKILEFSYVMNAKGLANSRNLYLLCRAIARPLQLHGGHSLVEFWLLFCTRWGPWVSWWPYRDTQFWYSSVIWLESYFLYRALHFSVAFNQTLVRLDWKLANILPHSLQELKRVWYCCSSFSCFSWDD